MTILAYLIGCSACFIGAIFTRELLSIVGVSYVSCVQYVSGLADRMSRSVNNMLAPQWEQVNERLDNMEKQQRIPNVIHVLQAQIAQLTAVVATMAKQLPMVQGDNGQTIACAPPDMDQQDQTVAYEQWSEDSYVAEQIAAMELDDQDYQPIGETKVKEAFDQYVPPAPEMLSARSVRDPFTCKLVLASDNTIAAITLDGGPFTHYGFHESTATYKQGRIGWYAGTGQLITWESRNTGKSMVGVVLGVDSATGHHVVCPVNDNMEKQGRITRKDLGKVRIIHAAPEPTAVSWSYAGQRQETAPEPTPEEIEKPQPKVAPRNGKATSKNNNNPLVDATLLFGQGIKVRMNQPLIVLRDSTGQLVREGSKIRWFSPTGKKGRDLPGLQRRFKADPISLSYAEISQLVNSHSL